MYLLDSHVLLWAITEPERLSAPTQALLLSTEQVVYVSAVSVWELAIKQHKSKLECPDNLAETAQLSGFSLLNITPQHAAFAATLPDIHDDLFDRMLVAQAMLEKLILITSDKEIPRYSLSTLVP